MTDDAFEAFWNAYPRKVGRGAARKAWGKASAIATTGEIMVGLQRYKESLIGKDAQFIAHPSTWLNQQRWLDEPTVAVAESGVAVRPVDPKLTEQMRITIIAQKIKRELLERTRAEEVKRLEAAAKKLRSTPIEVWGCLLPQIEGRAWDFAVEDAAGGRPVGRAIKITDEDWINCKDRVESRARHIAAMPNRQWSSSVSRVTSTVRKEDQLNAQPAEDEGMARSTPDEDRWFGCEHPAVGEPGDDPGFVEGEDRQEAT